MSNYLLTYKAVEDLSDIWNYTCFKRTESQVDIYYRLIICNVCFPILDLHQGKL